MSKQIVPDKIKLVSVKLLSGSIDCPREIATNNIIIGTLKTDFEADFNVTPQNKTARYYFKVMLQALDGNAQSLPITAEYSFELIYVIENLEEYLVGNSSKQVLVEQVLANTLMGITYSTSRGIVLARTEGTILGGVILPVIDPRILIEHKVIKQG